MTKLLAIDGDGEKDMGLILFVFSLILFVFSLILFLASYWNVAFLLLLSVSMANVDFMCLLFFIWG
jgi:hypothetical protein